MRLFFSYAHVDSVIVEDLADVLRAGGFNPLWDDQLYPGDNWKKELRQQIQGCDAFLCIVSEDSVGSEWCQWELAYAAELSKPIIPIIIRKGTPLPDTISHLHYLDISSAMRPRDVAKLIGKLAVMKEQELSHRLYAEKEPSGLPSRFKKPLPKNYLTVSQGFLQPLTPDLKLYEWPNLFKEKLPSTSSHAPIGIDFGTSQSSVAIFQLDGAKVMQNEYGDLNTTSAVAIGVDGKPIIGRRAASFLLQYPERGIFEVKRLFGYEIEKELGGTPVLIVDDVAYSPVHLAAFIFEKLRKDAISHLQHPVRDVVLTAPADFDRSQYSVLNKAAELAGLNVLRIITEPVAACIGMRWQCTNDEMKVLVYDLGGGTFDASVLEIGEGVAEVKSVCGDTRLGGADFDRVIVDYCLQQFRKQSGVDLTQDATALIRIREVVEEIKIALSTIRAATVHVPYITKTKGTLLNLTVDITRTRYNELTNMYVDKTIQLIHSAIKDSSFSLEDIDRALIVGRAARTPSIIYALRDLFGKRTHIAPDYIVAKGAAEQNAALSGKLRDLLLLDLIPHNLGVQLSGNKALRFIAKNTTIPTLKYRLLMARKKDGKRLLIRTFAGDSSDPEQNLFLTELTISLDSIQSEEFFLSISLDIDANSVLTTAVNLWGHPEKFQTLCRTRGLESLSIDKYQMRREECFVYPLQIDATPQKVSIQLSDNRTLTMVERKTALPIKRSSLLKAKKENGKDLLIRIFAGENYDPEIGLPLLERTYSLSSIQSNEVFLLVTLEFDEYAKINEEVYYLKNRHLYQRLNSGCIFDASSKREIEDYVYPFEPDFNLEQARAALRALPSEINGEYYKTMNLPKHISNGMRI